MNSNTESRYQVIVNGWVVRYAFVLRQWEVAGSGFRKTKQDAISLAESLPQGNR